MVEERPLIWDKTREDFKDRNKSKAAWQEIIDTFIHENLNEAEKAEIGFIAGALKMKRLKFSQELH
ncbi:unnamed protein product [Acanthoscelides obtectus]|uniref:MADF domain-containing protein n=1 Tax=Acanthoscelides obtectus TaxID=200917 RepID=A0A9P0JYQ5_ACAOB|nr:unnamed protein product [Acanthoscelides obtectus]CAK1668906.1 hypothetical protein AOBTE_LOCUS26681 [Acanthoscelides obtectus]